MNTVAIAVIVSVAAQMPVVGGKAKSQTGPAAQSRRAAAKKDTTPATGSDGPADAKQAAERVVQFAKEAGDRLGGKDPGTQTRELQSEVLKNLDAIIHQASNPPAPQQNQAGQPPPNGGASGGDSSSQPQSAAGAGSANGRSAGKRTSRQKRDASSAGSTAGQGGASGAPRPEQTTRGPGTVGRSSPGDDKRGTAGAGESERRSPPVRVERMNDLYKDVWGHLPERLRQEMDLYYRERFMPRYQDLLRQYYSSLAERQRASERE